MIAPASGPSPTSDQEAERSAAARWEIVEALFDAALSRAPADRDAFLEESCPDAETRGEVEALLAAHDGRGLVDELADDLMAPLLASRAPAVDPGSMSPIHLRYRILDRLGGGGMGVVYRARDERLERDVALKFLKPHLSADHAAKMRFLLEARAAAAIEHPNICTVHEIGDTDDGQLYIVMAYYDGDTLDRRIAHGPFPVDEALRVAADVARGLVKSHERGIVHRDIKPANVAVTSDGLVKILDFGIAKLTDAGGGQAMDAAGTMAYMSPEQAFGEVVDHRTDVWSLGVVLYEMLTGIHPFRAPGAQAALYDVLALDPEPVSSVRSAIPVELDWVVSRALAKRPADRFASAADLLVAIEECRASLNRVPAGSASSRTDEAPDAAHRRGGERRPVAVVACAIAGSETLVERLSTEAADAVLAKIRDAAAEVATRFSGIVNHFSVDGFVMLFGVPTAHEDDALRAVRAALALHAAVAEIAASLGARLSAALRLRSGVHVGPVVAQRLREGDLRFRITGAPVDVASRLASVASTDAVLVSPEIRRLVGPFVHTTEAAPISLRADAAPVVPHRVLRVSEVRSRFEGMPLTALTPFVGRERERATLAEQLVRARAGTGRVTVIVGEAGVGKSRLVHELRHSATAAGMRVLLGRCEEACGTTPFLPFVEALQEALGLLGDDADPNRHDAAVAAVRLLRDGLEELLPFYLALLAIPSERYPVPAQLRGELIQTAMLDAVATFFTQSSRGQPTLLLLEDWHWADEASRAALRQLASTVSGAPLLVVVTSRPDDSADWESVRHHWRVQLTPLDVRASAEIACAVLHADRVAPDLFAHLHERTGGNPFFLEEVCEALREAGAVTIREGEAVAVDASGAVQVPETVQGVLRARIDWLDEDTRDVLRVSSVLGREFRRGVLDDVMEYGISITESLERLKSSGLIQQIGIAPEAIYRFKHALTREVAYASLLEHQRATLHAAAGRATIRRYAAHLDEHVERLAHHFSRAESWLEAVRYGMRAADRAAALSQTADALNALQEVEGWVGQLPDDATRRELLADVLLRQERLCEMLGARNRQLELTGSLIALLAPHGPSEQLSQAYLRQGDAFTLLRRFDAAELSLETARQLAVASNDGYSERNALRSIALLRTYQGRQDEARAMIEHVLELSRQAGDFRAEAGDMATLANILRASGQSALALEALEAALARTAAAENPIHHAALLNVIGSIHRDRGDPEMALAYFHRVASEGLEPRHPVNASFTLPAIAHIQLQQGRTEEALATYRRAVELNRKAGYADGLANACRALGEVLVGLDRQREALPHLRDAMALFAQLQDRSNEALMWHRMARAHERLEEPGDAHGAWKRARALRQATGDVAGEADAVEGMARVERLLGVTPDAIVARYEEALALATRLGDANRELAIRNALGIVHWQRGDYADAVRHYDVALQLCREAGDQVHEALILNSLGATLLRQNRWDEARAALLAGIRVASSTGERQLEAQALATLGDVCLATGRFAEAQVRVEASLALRRELHDRRAEGWMLERLARVHAARGAFDALQDAVRASGVIAHELQDDSLHAAVARLSSPAAPAHTTTW